MEIPSVKRSNRLGYSQGGGVADPNVAGSKGRAIASFGEQFTQTSAAIGDFMDRANASGKALAVKDAESEFAIFKAKFDQSLKDNEVEGDDYAAAYDKAYSEFSNTYLKGKTKHVAEMQAALKDKYSSNLGSVHASGAQKYSADLINKNNELTKKEMVLIQQNPANFQSSLMRMTELTIQRVQAGEIKSSYAKGEIARISKAAAIASVDGYVMAKGYEKAKAFLRNEEVGNMLGGEDRATLMEEVERKQAEDYNLRANREDRDYSLKMRAITEKQNSNFADLLQTARLAKSPAQLELIEKDVLSQARTMGLDATQAKGMLSVMDDRYQYIDGESDMYIAKKMTHVKGVEDLTGIENELVKYVAGKKMLHDTATKWFNVIRALRNKQTSDPRTIPLRKAYRLKLEGYLPDDPLMQGMDDEERLKRNTVLSDFELEVINSDPKTAYETVMKKHRALLTTKGEFSSVLGQGVSSFKELDKVFLNIFKYKQSGMYSDKDIKRMENEAIMLRNELLIKEEIKNAVPDNVMDAILAPEQNQQIQSPYRRD